MRVTIPCPPPLSMLAVCSRPHALLLHHPPIARVARRSHASLPPIKSVCLSECLSLSIASYPLCLSAFLCIVGPLSVLPLAVLLVAVTPPSPTMGTASYLLAVLVLCGSLTCG